MDVDLIHDRLQTDRRVALTRIESMAGDYAQIVAASRDTNADDEHDPEGSTIAFERAQAAALLSQTRQDVAALDAALVRLNAGRYGTCEVCGESIGEDRLAARPATARCIQCARRR